MKQPIPFLGYKLKNGVLSDLGKRLQLAAVYPSLLKKANYKFLKAGGVGAWRDLAFFSPYAARRTL